jgi:hypothetical protein
MNCDKPTIAEVRALAREEGSSLLDDVSDEIIDKAIRQNIARPAVTTGWLGSMVSNSQSSILSALVYAKPSPVAPCSIASLLTTRRCVHSGEQCRCASTTPLRRVRKSPRAASSFLRDGF